MKREELKATLNKIQPGEELIQTTLRKVEMQKNKKTRFSFWNTAVYRYEAAVCTLVLLCGVGLMTGKLSGDKNAVLTPQGMAVGRGVLQENAEEYDTPVAVYSLEEEQIRTTGVLCDYTLCELTEAEKAFGIVAHALLTVQPEQGTKICAEMFFYEEAKLQELKAAVSGKLDFLLLQTAEEGNTWRVLDFSIPETR